MKHLLEKGKISILLSDNNNAGWSGEVHLIEYKKEKYVVRRAKTLVKAKYYEKISNQLEKQGFLPKFLCRLGRDALYEYIDGRDLRKKESAAIIKQIGAISAQINKIEFKGSINLRFNTQIKETTTGIFKKINKKVRPLLSEERATVIKKLYNALRKEVNPKITLDANDISPNNFRLRNGKVYFVDVEAIKPRIKGFGIGKAFTKWFKTPQERMEFINGYNSVSSTKFLTERYLDFIFLNFLVQELNYTCMFGKKFKPRIKLRKNELESLLKKYKA